MQERRQYQRFTIIGNISLIIGEQEINCVAYDISEGGIGFVTHENPSLGTKAIVYCPKINFKKSGIIISLGVAKKYPNMHKYGLQFDALITNDELQRCLNGLGTQ